MSYKIFRADYFYTTVKDQPGEAYRLLSTLAGLGINLLAFTAVPIGPMTTQLTLFPGDKSKLINEAARSGLTLDGPHRALLVQGDDELGAVADLHAKLYRANVNVYASNGVTDGDGCFGYIFYVRPEDYEKAAVALGV